MRLATYLAPLLLGGGLLTSACGTSPPINNGGDSCHLFQTDVEAVWSEDVARNVQQQMAMATVDAEWTQQAYLRVETGMDAASSDWVRLTEQACREREQGGSAEVYDKKRACFDSALTQMRVTSMGLTDLSAEGVTEAVEEVERLRDRVGRCVVDAVWQAYEPMQEGAQQSPEERALEQSVAEAGTERRLGNPQQALEEARQAVATSDEVGNQRLATAAHLELGESSAALEQFDEAAPAFEQALRLARARQDPLQQAEAEWGLGNIALRQDRPRDAMEHMRAAARHVEALGDDTSRSAQAARADAARQLGRAALALGDVAAAQRHFERALTRAREAYGDEHPMIARAHENLVAVLLSSDAEAAVRHARQAVEMQERLLGEGHPETALARVMLATALGQAGRIEEARRQATRAREALVAALPAGHTEIGRASNLIGALRLGSDPGAALDAFETALPIFRTTFGDDHIETAQVRLNMALALQALGRASEAAAQARAALPAVPAGHPLRHRAEQLAALEGEDE